MAVLGGPRSSAGTPRPRPFPPQVDTEQVQVTPRKMVNVEETQHHVVTFLKPLGRETHGRSAFPPQFPSSVMDRGLVASSTAWHDAGSGWPAVTEPLFSQL